VLEYKIVGGKYVRRSGTQVSKSAQSLWTDNSSEEEEAEAPLSAAPEHAFKFSQHGVDFDMNLLFNPIPNDVLITEESVEAADFETTEAADESEDTAQGRGKYYSDRSAFDEDRKGSIPPPPLEAEPNTSPLFDKPKENSILEKILGGALFAKEREREQGRKQQEASSTSTASSKTRTKGSPTKSKSSNKQEVPLRSDRTVMDGAQRANEHNVFKFSDHGAEFDIDLLSNPQGYGRSHAGRYKTAEKLGVDPDALFGQDQDKVFQRSGKFKPIPASFSGFKNPFGGKDAENVPDGIFNEETGSSPTGYAKKPRFPSNKPSLEDIFRLANIENDASGFMDIADNLFHSNIKNVNIAGAGGGTSKSFYANATAAAKRASKRLHNMIANDITPEGDRTTTADGDESNQRRLQTSGNDLTLVASLKNPNPGSSWYNFGWQVDVTNGYAMAGDPSVNQYTGVAYLYSMVNNKWTLSATLQPPAGSSGYYYCYSWYQYPGAYSYFGSTLGISGNYAAVGAPGANTYSGAVYIYTVFDTTWSLVQQLSCPDGSYDYFGYAISLSNKWLVIGAPGYANW
jgi:hypothetical protein